MQLPKLIKAQMPRIIMLSFIGALIWASEIGLWLQVLMIAAFVGYTMYQHKDFIKAQQQMLSTALEAEYDRKQRRKALTGFRRIFK